MNTPDLNQLFLTAANEGLLSQQSLNALNVNDIGAQIQAGLGTPVDQVQASEVILVTQMPDDSASIRFGTNAQLVREGHNTVLDSLQSSKQKDTILAHTRYLNGHVLFPYCPLAQAVRMDKRITIRITAHRCTTRRLCCWAPCWPSHSNSRTTACRCGR